MKLVKKTKDYSIFQKRSERYAVRNSDRQWVLGEDKLTILLKEGLMKKPEPKPVEEEPAQESEAAEGEAPEETTAEG